MNFEFKEDGVYMMCLLVDDTPRAHVPSVTKACAKCSRPVWVSDASVQIAISRSAEYVCNECFMERMDSLPSDREITLQVPTKEQVEEIVESARDITNEEL